MLVSPDCSDYRSLVERHAPFGFARHFGLIELLADREMQFAENALLAAGLAPMAMVQLGEYTRQDHRYRWVDNALVRAVHELARSNEGFGVLLQDAFNPDLLSPFELGAACSVLTEPNPTSFFLLMKSSGFSLVLVAGPPPELSLSATLATLRETARYCQSQDWLPILVGQLGFECQPTEKGAECRRGGESFTAHYHEDRLVLSYAKTHARLRTSASLGLVELLEKGLTAFDQKDFDAAYEAFNEAAALDPQSYKANLYLGRIELHRENFGKAQLRLQLAVGLEPTRTFALAQLAVCYDRSNRQTLALNARRKVLLIDPDDAYSHAHLGILLGRSGHIDEGIESLEAAVQLDLERAYPVRELAALYAQQGRLGEAIAAYEHALGLEPEHGRTQLQLRKLRA